MVEIESGLAVTRSERELLANYVERGKLMQVATVSRAFEPQVCHVWYAPSFHPDMLHFISRNDRAHSRNIRENGNVAGGIVAIPLEGLGQKVVGVSFVGVAQEIPPGHPTEAALAFLRRWPNSNSSITTDGRMVDGSPMRLYRIAVSTWTLFDEVHFPAQPRREIQA